MEKTIQFTLDIPIEASYVVCKVAIKKFSRDYKDLQEDTSELIRFIDTQDHLTMCVIKLNAITASETLITINENTKSIALGPFWSNYLEKRVNNKKEEIERCKIPVEKDLLERAKELINDSKACPTCGKLVPQGTRFCPDDGTQLMKICSKCGAGNLNSSKFCADCGASL